MSKDYKSLSAFPVNEEVLKAIRPMAFKDCKRVAQLHYKAMGRSLWAKLGEKFLKVLYQELLKNDCLFTAFVYEASEQKSPDKKTVEGFIAGSINTGLLFRTTLRRSWRTLTLPVIEGILRNPSVIFPLVTTPFYFPKSDPTNSISAESLFCSFSPNLRGTKISGHINKVFFEQMLKLGSRYVKITTEVSNAGSNRQLRSWGFEEVHHFRFYGKDMVTYVLDMKDHPRLAHKS